MKLLPGIAKRLEERARLRPSTLDPVPLDLPRAAGSIRHVRSEEEARDLLAELRSVTLSAIALDTEYGFDRPAVPLRSGADWRDIRSQRPLCVSLAAWAHDGLDAGFVIRAVLDVRENAVVAVLGEIQRLRALLVFHHAKVDLFSLWALGLDPDLHQVFDTYVAAIALDLGLGHKRARRPARNETDAEQIRSERGAAEQRTYDHSLVGQCAHYGLGYPFSESKDALRDRFLRLEPDQPLGEREVEYAAADAEWTLRLYVAQEGALLQRGLQSHLWTVEFPFTVANARIEWNGVHVDPERREQLRHGARQAAEHYARELATYGIDPPGSRPKFLAVMREAGLGHLFQRHGKASTEDGLLETLEGAHPAVRALRLHRRYSRLAGEEWLTGCLVGADGRTHAVHRQLGAATGRNSCSTPNIAGIGRVLRPVVTAPPGRALVELDYSQIEVGVAAAEHQDPDLIAAFNSGDVYAAMAQRFYAERLTEEERALPPQEFKRRRRDLREAIKTFVLAVIYNIQAPAIAARFGIAVAQAEQERERFLASYPKLRQGLEESAAYGAVRGDAAMVSGLRRRREWRGKPNSWTLNFLRNTPIQGSAAVVFKKAVADLDRAFRRSSTWLVLPVHDSILIECDLARVEDVAGRARRIMEEALAAYYPELQPRVDVDRSAPWCWNKDGHADSLEQFLADPTFRIGGGPSRPTVPVGGQEFFDFDGEGAPQPEPSPFEDRLLRAADCDPDAAGVFIGLTEDLVEAAEERAGVYEFDACMSRAEAEERAAAEVEDRLRHELSRAGLGVAAMEMDDA